MDRIVSVLQSLKITILCLSLSMVLVILGTLAQVNMGLYAATKFYFESIFLYWSPSDTVSIPVFPGGALLGALLIINLLARYLVKLKQMRKRFGILLVHMGLILLLLGGYISTFAAVESQMAIEEGQTVSYSRDPRKIELVFMATSNPDYDEVVSIPASLFQKGKAVSQTDLPFTVEIIDYYPNSELSVRLSDDSPSRATRGSGTGITVHPLSSNRSNPQTNISSAFVKIMEGSKRHGTWLVSNGMNGVQSVRINETTYEMALRHTRYYLPFSMTLKDFKHDRYAGTNIPKNFSSLVNLQHFENNDNRDAVISMNHPLRYEGKTFYQASFGKQDMLSILQVVENPGWVLPYVSCTIIALGLLIHFMQHLYRFSRRLP